MRKPVMLGLSMAVGVLGLMAAGCVRVEPVRVQVDPIHVTVDLNVKIQKVDAALENFFGDISGAKTNTPASATAPAEEKKP